MVMWAKADTSISRIHCELIITENEQDCNGASRQSSEEQIELLRRRAELRSHVLASTFSVEVDATSRSIRSTATTPLWSYRSTGHVGRI